MLFNSKWIGEKDMKNIQFSCTVISVENIEKSKKFYMEVFDEEIKFDFGRSIAFKSGISLQEDFDWLTKTEKSSIQYQSHSMELCYEVLDFDLFLLKLEKVETVEFIHDVFECDWKQRVIHLYDPDKHIIEVGEAMSSVVKRYIAKGMSVEEVSKITQHPIEFVIESQQNTPQDFS